MIIGSVIIIWSGLHIISEIQPHDTYRANGIENQSELQCQAHTGTFSDKDNVTKNTVCFKLNNLSSSEQRIIRKSINESPDTVVGPKASKLPHLESGDDAPAPGHGKYGIEANGTYYQLVISSDSWENIGLFAYLPAFIIGCIFLLIGIVYLFFTMAISKPPS